MLLIFFVGGKLPNEYGKDVVEKRKAIQKAVVDYAVVYDLGGILRMLNSVLYGEND